MWRRLPELDLGPASQLSCRTPGAWLLLLRRWLQRLPLSTGPLQLAGSRSCTPDGVFAHMWKRLRPLVRLPLWCSLSIRFILC